MEQTTMSRIDSANPYRVQGNIMSMAELAKNKPGFAVQATPEQIEELALHDQQVAARQAAVAQYAAEHPDQIYAQVVAQGKVVATVYDSGITVVTHNAPGLTLSENGDGLALAKTRLAELMQAIPGKAIYSGFTAPPMPPSSNIPESALPAVTARDLVEMARQMDWQLARARMAIDQPAGD